MFYPLDKLDPVRPMTPDELNARFAPDDTWRTREKQGPLTLVNQPPYEPTPACAPKQFEDSGYDYYPGLRPGDEDRQRTRSR
jgi:hypothetical protein